MRNDGHFREDAITPFLTFPFDARYIYYADRHKWLNEARSDYRANLHDNEFLITVPEPRKETETRPVFTTLLANLHVHERGSVVFPRETTSDDLLGDRDENLAEPVWRAIASTYGLTGVRRDAVAREMVGALFRVVFAMLYAPAYQAEHKSVQSSDWAHVRCAPLEGACHARAVLRGPGREPRHGDPLGRHVVDRARVAGRHVWIDGHAGLYVSSELASVIADSGWPGFGFCGFDLVG